MISALEFPILLVFGIVTALLAVQFLFPRWYSKTFNGFVVESDAGAFYARQGGLAIAIQGVFLIWAAFDVEIRTVCLALVGVGKLVFVLFIWLNIVKFRGLIVTAVIDSIAVLLFGALLLGL